MLHVTQNLIKKNLFASIDAIYCFKSTNIGQEQEVKCQVCIMVLKIPSQILIDNKNKRFLQRILYNLFNNVSCLSN